MSERAKAKITAENVEFCQLNVCEIWNFAEGSFDLITCSLALERIENIDFVFEQARKVLRENGHFHFGELHRFEQYLETEERFETG